MKDSFVFYKSFYDAIRKVPEEYQLELYNAVLSYSLEGIEPNELSPIGEAMFILIKPNIDSSQKRYETSVENGKKGGRPKNKTQEKPNNNLEETQQEPKQNLNVDVDVDDNVDVDVDDTEVKCPYQKIVDIYHEVCISYPKIRNLSKTRKQALKARYLEYKKDMNIFTELFIKAENSNFLKGKNDNNWSANFDWMINSNNMTKILENKYKNKEKNNGEIGGNTGKYSGIDFSKNRAKQTGGEIDDSGVI